MNMITSENANRFWGKVKLPDAIGTDECWEWMAGKIPQGYGSFWIDGKNRRASRVAWEISNGRPISETHIICHTCDNRSCVNPSHLYLGTWKTNAEDREVRGRGNRPCGESHANSLITANDVIEIRRLRDEDKLKLNEIAALYSLSFQHVSAIIHRKRWANV